MQPEAGTCFTLRFLQANQANLRDSAAPILLPTLGKVSLAPVLKFGHQLFTLSLLGLSTSASAWAVGNGGIRWPCQGAVIAVCGRHCQADAG